MPKKVIIFGFVALSALVSMSLQWSHHQKPSSSNCLFKNPLCFYNTDILCYQQTLYKTMQFDKMATFFYGPAVESRSKAKFISDLSKAQFGYDLKRVGVTTVNPKSWSLMYQKTIQATKETFTIKCSLVRDTCRIWIDEQTFGVIFSNSR
jgi:hypothetical protein